MKSGLPTTSVIYLLFDNVTIQLSIFHDRGDFFWIGKDETRSDVAKWFGDTHRAMNLYVSVLIIHF
jgi:hypothetical protein